MRTIDYSTVMTWLPCPEFPPERIKELFGDRETLMFPNLLAMPIDIDAKLWAGLRQEFLNKDQLRRFAHDCLVHVEHLREHPDENVRIAHSNAVKADDGEFEGLPQEHQTCRWMTGATREETIAGLTAMWCAVAVARADEDKARAWEHERFWQLRHATSLHLEVCDAD